jgi:hypothetical protein
MGLLTSFLHAHVSLMVCCGTFFYFHQVFSEGLHPNWWQGFGISKPNEKVDIAKVRRNEKIMINIMMIEVQQNEHKR